MPSPYADLGGRLTGKQEAFLAEYLANGRNATAAYRKAYPDQAKSSSEAALNVNACRLTQNPKIELRLVKLDQAKAVTMAETADTGAAMLAKLRDEGVRLGQLGPAVAAETARLKLLGLFVERTAVQHSVAALSDHRPDIMRARTMIDNARQSMAMPVIEHNDSQVIDMIE